MIEVNGLRKTFGDIVAVDSVTFTAHDGAVTALLGPNGAGKSTTLRMLSTLLTPDAGSARIDGFEVATHPMEVRRSLGVLPETRGLSTRLTARENVRYFGELHGLRGEALESRVDRLLRSFELGALADRSVAGFSQGERVKVALARALVHDPKTVILDEPTNGLDVMATRALRETIGALKAAGKCVVFSSHIMQEVAQVSDAIVIIARGRVVASGTAEALRAQTGKANLEDAFLSFLPAAEGSSLP